MNARSISSLKPNVGQEEAIRTFSSIGMSAIYWRLRSGPLRRIAPAYVPFSLYRVRYQMSGRLQQRVFAMDAVDGSLDLFHFPAVPKPEELVELATCNVLPATLPELQATRLLHDKVLRLIFQQGFFKVSDPQLEIAREAVEFHLPYWLGFYGHGNLRCRVLDAVRRRFEGAKATTFFETWLAA